MAIDVWTEKLIRRPRGAVAAYAVDPDNATAWYGNIKQVRWETEKPLAVRSRVAFVAEFLGRRLTYTYEVRELVAGQLFVMATAQGPFAMETTYVFNDAPDGATTMRLRNRGEPSGFSRLLTPVMGPAVARANRQDLARLKEILERQT